MRAGTGLALAGMLALVALMVFVPLPAKLDQLGVTVPTGDTSAWFAARGPALSRYDAQTDTTEARFLCGHGYCSTTIRLAGDQQARVSGQHVLLHATDGPFHAVALDEPFESPDAIGERDRSTHRAAGEWRAFPAWPFALLYALATTAVAIGVVRLARAARMVELAPIFAGALALVAAMETNWMTIYLFVILGLPLLGLAAGAGWLLSRRHPRWAMLPRACLAFGLAFLPLTLALNTFFPMPPEL